TRVRSDFCWAADSTISVAWAAGSTPEALAVASAAAPSDSARPALATLDSVRPELAIVATVPLVGGSGGGAVQVAAAPGAPTGQPERSERRALIPAVTRPRNPTIATTGRTAITATQRMDIEALHQDPSWRLRGSA